MKLKVENLSCGNCAQKIEDEIQSLGQVDNAQINLMEEYIIINGKNIDTESFIRKINEIADRIEPGSKFTAYERKNITKQKIVNQEFIKILIATILFVTHFFTQQPYSIIAALIAYIIIGSNIVFTAAKNVVQGEVFDESLMMSIASLGAIGIQKYDEAVAVMLLYSIGEYLQDLAVNRSRTSIASLAKITPDVAHLYINGVWETVDPDKLEIGQRIKVLPGERIPVDSKVIKGHSTLDTSSITGEAVPLVVEKDSEVVSGMINNDGVLELIVQKKYEDSTVNKIMELVESASSNKTRAENFLTKFSRTYTPVVVFLALLLVSVPTILGMDFKTWLYRALIFLVVSCPCAILISIPLNYFAALGVSSKKGILLKGSNFFEALSEAKTFIFDKTGTLTTGNFQIQSVNLVDKDCDNMKAMIASLEKNSNHPIAKAISTLSEEEVSFDRIEEFPGKGIRGESKNIDLIVGNRRLLDLFNISYPEIESTGSISYIANNGKFIGYIELGDEIKNDAQSTVKRLKQDGNEIYVLSGDREKACAYISEKIGADGYYCELKPDDKIEKLKEIRKKRQGKVCFVGDGTNDAPSLRYSDVGIALGDMVTDAAMESSDILIPANDLSHVYEARNIAIYARQISIQNLVFALFTKSLILLLSAMGLATMWMAVFADVGVAILCILNSMRIFLKENKKIN